MMQFDKLADIWTYYDDVDRKNFLSCDIVAAINSLPKSFSDSDISRYEWLAFSFSENSSLEIM